MSTPTMKNEVSLDHYDEETQEKMKMLAFSQLRAQGEKVYNEEQCQIEEIQTRVQQLFLRRPMRDFYSHQIESYEQFIQKLVRFLSDSQNSINNIFPKEDHSKQYYIKLIYENPTVSLYPTNNMSDIMTPDHAYMINGTYSSAVVCDAIKLQKIFVTKKGDEVIEQRVTVVEYKQKDQLILFRIPTMVRSKWCVTTKEGVITNLDPSDPGCFFICNGQSKTITPLERSPNNKIIIFRNVKKNTVNAVVNSLSFTSEYTNKNTLQVIFGQKVKFQGKGIEGDVTDQFLFVETSQFDNQNQTIQVEKEKVQYKAEDDDDENKEGAAADDEQEKMQISDSKDKPSVFLLLTMLGVTEDKQILELCAFGDARIYLELTLILQKYRTDSAQGQIRTSEKAKEFLQNLKSGKLQMKLIEQIIISDILPHCCDSKNVEENYTSKARFLGLMVYKVMCVHLRLNADESRDSYLNKRIVACGELLYQKFEHIYKKSIIQNLRTQLFNKNQSFISSFGTEGHRENLKTLEEIKNDMVEAVLNKNNITSELENSIITGKWSATMTGVAKQLPNSSIPAKIASLKMVSNAPVFRKQKHTSLETRHINNNQMGFYCPVGSPDGADCGIVKEMSISCDITIDFAQIRDTVRQHLENRLDDFDGMHYKTSQAGLFTKIFVFGKLLFLTRDPARTIEFLREARFEGIIPRYVTFELQSDWNEILIFGDAGRMVRPLLVLETRKDKSQHIRDHDAIYKKVVVNNEITTWEGFVAAFPRSIEWVDIQEVSNKMVAGSAQILLYNNVLRAKRGVQRKGGEIDENSYQCIDNETKNRFDGVYQNFDHIELHPINVLGINPSTIPYPHCNYAPRNIFAFVQMKRGVQKPFSDNDLRQDINQYLILGQAPLVQTMSTNMINSNRNFNGSNICVAVLMENGFQQEDSITISSRLARSNYLQCKQDIIEEVIMKQTEIIGRPENIMDKASLARQTTRWNYDKIGDDGLIREGAVVRKGDVIIGKVLVIKQDGMDTFIDKSVRFDYEEGVIVKVKRLPSEGQNKIIIRFIIPLYPQIGDKYAARCGQKGTIGTIRDENLMPYTMDGTPIDIIINPCSFSTRMTIGMNIEHYTSYLTLMTGMFLDASMFCDVKNQLERTFKVLCEKYDAEKLAQKESFGDNAKRTSIYRKTNVEYQRNQMGQKKIYSGNNGRSIGYAQVGFVFYAAQEQKAFSKLYAVGFGEAARNQVFQPREGGKNHGGSRLGEMEMAAFLSAGLSNIVKSFAWQHSDGFTVQICSQCGVYASRDQNQKKWYCKACEGKSECVSTHVQYSSKHFKDLLNSLGISLNCMPSA